MKAAFYKGHKTLFNRAVRWWDDGPYSHMELVLDDGLCLSSSFLDGGVRAKQVVFDAGKWDFIDLHDLFGERSVLEFFQHKEGVRYDLLGTLGFIIGPTQRQNRLFCSEFCMQALGFDNAWRLSPNGAFQALLWLLGTKGPVVSEAVDGNTTHRLFTRSAVLYD